MFLNSGTRYTRPSCKIGPMLMKPTSMVKTRRRHLGDHQRAIRRVRQLSAPQVVTGRERRRINPNHGYIKLLERNVDMVVSGLLYPHLSRIWNPYSWLLQRRFSLATASISPWNWPRDLDPTRVLLISDIHAGIFLKPQTLSEILCALMELNPDLVAIVGDIVSGHSSEVRPYLEALAQLSHAPLGAWFCYGNHDYFDGNAEDIQTDLASVGITTLKNGSISLRHCRGEFVLGGIDDLLLGKPDWNRLCFDYGPPHLLLAHNPDHFYQANAHGIPLILSGHTHGGQIRFPNGPPIIRQSRYCLDEGMYSYRSSVLIVSRGLGSVGLPWRWGADPEAILIDILPR
jgi:predicted MPP superfamily phosphohydrolase